MSSLLVARESKLHNIKLTFIGDEKGVKSTTTILNAFKTNVTLREHFGFRAYVSTV